MEAGGYWWFSSSSSFPSSRRRRRRTLEEVRASAANFKTTTATTRQNFDRFIPDRSSMDMDLARFLLTQTKKERENMAAAAAAAAAASGSTSKDTYQKMLLECLLQNRTSILSFGSTPPATSLYSSRFHLLLANTTTHIPSSSYRNRTVKRQRFIPQSAERTLDAPDLVDDYCLNLLDWGSSNVLAIALGNTVYLWDASNGSASELMHVDEDDGPVTSVSWAPNGRHIALGMGNSEDQIWDVSSNRLLRTLRGAHQSRVGALSWNNHILSTGGMDGVVANHDVRAASHVVQTYRGRRLEVCGLKWSGSGQRLASGGSDHLIHIWDLSMSANRHNRWLHRFNDHMDAVKALAWCPFQSSLLASGGGVADGCIKFWNMNTGACLNTVDTCSHVSALLWSSSEKELLSSHGSPQNQLTLWNYPSMVKMAELTNHTSPVLFMAQSPDGCTVASAAAGDDESLRFWKVFGTLERRNPATRASNSRYFNGFDHIR